MHYPVHLLKWENISKQYISYILPCIARESLQLFIIDDYKIHVGMTFYIIL